MSTCPKASVKQAGDAWRPTQNAFLQNKANAAKSCASTEELTHVLMIKALHGQPFSVRCMDRDANQFGNNTLQITWENQYTNI